MNPNEDDDESERQANALLARLRALQIPSDSAAEPDIGPGLDNDFEARLQRLLGHPLPTSSDLTNFAIQESEESEDSELNVNPSRNDVTNEKLGYTVSTGSASDNEKQAASRPDDAEDALNEKRPVDQDDLVARFARLRAAPKPKSSPLPVDPGEDEVEEVASLLARARALLASTDAENSRGSDESRKAEESDGEDVSHASLRAALSSLTDKDGEDDNDQEQGQSGIDNDDKDWASASTLAYLARSALDDDELDGQDFTADLSTLPSSGPVSSAFRALQRGYTDEEIESWCVICYDDATIKCKGCGGELYCDQCWRKGHLGPDAGYEQRRHKALVLKRVRTQPQKVLA